MYRQTAQLKALVHYGCTHPLRIDPVNPWPDWTTAVFQAATANSFAF